MSKSFYLLTFDLFDSNGETWDQHSTLYGNRSYPESHTSFGFFENIEQAKQRYGEEIKRFDNPIRYETVEQIQLKSLYPGEADDIDCCCHAVYRERADIANVYEETVTLVKIELDDAPGWSQNSYLTAFDTCITLGELGIPTVSEIYPDGEKDIPEGLERVPLFR